MDYQKESYTTIAKLKNFAVTNEDRKKIGLLAHRLKTLTKAEAYTHIQKYVDTVHQQTQKILNPGETNEQ